MMDLRAINQNRFDVAKNFWLASVSLKFLMFSIGAVSIFVINLSNYIPQILLLLAVISEVLQWRSDIIKSKSESLLRKLDLCRSFQKEVSATDKREIVLDIPRSIRAQFENDIMSDTYFTNSEPPGPRKSIKNLIESAWYTRHQSGDMAIFCILLILFLVFVSIAALIVTSREIEEVNIRNNVSKVVTSWLLLVFSLGIFRNAWGYYKMYLRCQKTEDASEHLLRNDNILEADAIKQWYEYQLARSSAPLLPNWLWSIRKSSLDDAWKRTSIE
ncbi:hypothetical protein [Hymenobacter negativus]|uniref:DUF4231 domain-containing protein n=1 Tax=Hymenobacter negativus TaxID=2795026 RepID=A0ABS3QAT6_9BACT|nr:hypothetical protein [Hymenobacter negativus]MBO2007825.1 hypothetical protein [Hymenobacter negativus]